MCLYIIINMTHLCIEHKINTISGMECYKTITEQHEERSNEKIPHRVEQSVRKSIYGRRGISVSRNGSGTPHRTQLAATV